MPNIKIELKTAFDSLFSAEIKLKDLFEQIQKIKPDELKKFVDEIQQELEKTQNAKEKERLKKEIQIINNFTASL